MMRTLGRPGLLVFLFVVFVSFVVPSSAGEPCSSGLQAGQRPGPYAFVVATGPAAGQSTCYICETAERPAVVVFARGLSDPLGKLAGRIDKAVSEYKAADLRAWVTFLSDDQPTLDPQVVEWGRSTPRTAPRRSSRTPAAAPAIGSAGRRRDRALCSSSKRCCQLRLSGGELTEGQGSE